MCVYVRTYVHVHVYASLCVHCIYVGTYCAISNSARHTYILYKFACILMQCVSQYVHMCT